MATSISTPTSSQSTAMPFLAAGVYDLFRVMTGLLFMQHGVQKMFGLLVDPSTPWSGAPPAFSQFWFAGVLELALGLLIAVGLFTRSAAFLGAGMMAVAYFQAHFPRSFFPIMNGGEAAVLYCFAFLALFVSGAGPISLDALLRRRRAAAPGGAAAVGARSTTTR